jgi:flagellar motility protein MotE (MotC chaperone)
MAQIDRRQRELADLQRQVDAATQQIQRDRAALGEDRQRLEAEKQQAARLQNDQGFQETLELYNTMSGKQVKTIFMTLDDKTMMQYLQAMQPRTAARIIKEFKTPEEVDRVHQVMEKMRQSQAAASAPATAPAGAVQASGKE